MKIRLQEFQENFKHKISPIQRSIPKVKLYEMDLSEFAARQEEMVTADETRASFTKGCTLNAAKNGLRAPGFWTGFYQIMIGNNWEMEGFSLSNAIGAETNCVMQFLPGSCTKLAAGFIADIARAQLGCIYDVVVLNSDHTHSAKAETEALDAVQVAREAGRKVWFISHGMAARSFSVPAIDVVLLTYDNGALGATMQKLSRALTAGDTKTIGHIVSIAVDPNREDKVAPIVLETAQKAAEKNGTDLTHELKRAYATFPLFSVDHTGNWMQLKEDEYIKRAMDLKASIPLTVDRSRLLTISEDDAQALVNQILSRQKRANRAGEKDALAKGTRFIDSNRKAREVDHKEHERALNILLEQLDAFVHNLDVVRWMSDLEHPQLSDILSAGDKDPATFEADCGMTPQLVRDCLDIGLLRRAIVDTVLLAVA